MCIRSALCTSSSTKIDIMSWSQLFDACRVKFKGTIEFKVRLTRLNAHQVGSYEIYHCKVCEHSLGKRNPAKFRETTQKFRRHHSSRRACVDFKALQVTGERSQTWFVSRNFAEPANSLQHPHLFLAMTLK